MPLTTQQHDAVYRRLVSVVLSSGAGCGKTHVLTQRYLSHLREDGADVGQVVAITFTERAARQMRERIRGAVTAHLQAAVSDDEVSLWGQHLQALEAAQISTIHAFCATLLRQHAVEAGLDPRFDVLEDYLAVNLENEALATALQSLLTSESAAGEDLRQLVLVFGWKAAAEGVRSLLRDLEPAARKAWLQKSPHEVAADWLRYARCELLPRYVHYLTSASPKIAGCLRLLRTTPCHGPRMAANVAAVFDGTAKLGACQDLAAAVAEITGAAKVTGTEMAKAWASQEVYESIKEALAGLRADLPARLKMFADVLAGGPGDDVLEAARTGQRFVRVADEVARTARQLKRRNSVVDFQDLLVQARDLLRDHADVRDRLQRRFRFLLIDELQDTDPVQMELVEYLTGDGLAEGKLFAVGDHSQSIYRFRGADVHLFQALRRKMAEGGRLGLTLNFRSQPAILEFVNALFEPTGGGPGATGLEDYEPLQAFHAKVNPGACVEFLWSPRSDDASVTDARTLEAEWLARRVAGMVASREPLVAGREGGGRLRPVEPGDVVLLFRAMTNVEIYEAALRRHGLHYYLVGGRAFFAQQEIYDLLNLLRALENPQDAVCLAGTLRSPFCCLSDEALFVLARHRGGLWAALHDADAWKGLPRGQRQRVEQAVANLGRWRSLKNRLPIARLLGTVLADSGYDAAMQFEFLGDRKLANLWKLTDMARAFDRSGLFGLPEFIARLDDLVQTQPREEQAATQPENANVVRLMSIHQAKGLEFPVVVVPDLAATFGSHRRPAAVWDRRLGCVTRPPDEDPPPFGDAAWKIWEAGEAVADWREDLRTLYVACTRAMDYLVLSAALPDGFTPQTPWMLALAERFDLRTGRCLAPGRAPVVRVTDVFSEPPDVTLDQPPPPQAAPPPGDCADILADRSPLADASSLQVVAAWDLTGSAGHPFQWDAEDGSDGNAWPDARPARPPFEQVVRRVLSAWDLRDPDGWRDALRPALAALPSDGPKSVRPKLEEALSRFASSEVRARLAAAVELYSDLEFVVELPPAEHSLFPEPARQVWGVIDALGRDRAGAWHLVEYAFEPQLRRRESPPDASPAVLAVRRRLGSAPATVTRYSFADGSVASHGLPRLGGEQV